jgi:hypothetical protein
MSSDDPNGAKSQYGVGFRAHGMEQTAKLGAAFGQHERSEPPKPEGAATALADASGSKSGDRGVGGNTGSPIAFWGDEGSADFSSSPRA